MPVNTAVIIDQLLGGYCLFPGWQEPCVLYPSASKQLRKWKKKMKNLYSFRSDNLGLQK